MKDDPLPDGDHISRYCPPIRVHHGLPLASAFELRPQDAYLSVNWLEYWGEPDPGVALGLVRGELAVQAKADGRFAVLNVAKIKAAIDRLTGRGISVTRQPTPEVKSHAGIFGFSQGES